MYNELIDALRKAESDTQYYEAELYDNAAAALKAAEKRIAELERILKAVQENSGINFRLWQEAEAQLPKEGEWVDEQRGRWIYAKCNLCGKVQDARSNYCPNCGAKMNRKENADADN